MKNRREAAIFFNLFFNEKSPPKAVKNFNLFLMKSRREAANFLTKNRRRRRRIFLKPMFLTENRRFCGDIFLTSFF